MKLTILISIFVMVSLGDVEVYSANQPKSIPRRRMKPSKKA
jgi:hypothetical protein